jgi:hypothetical protein
LKGTHPSIIPARFGLIWLCSFSGKDLKLVNEIQKSLINEDDKFKENYDKLGKYIYLL